MLLTLLKAKLHRATVTQADLDYVGSITIDQALLDADGTPDKSRLGANALLGASLAVARAAAESSGLELFRYVEIDGRTKIVVKGQISDYIPNPTFQVVAEPGSAADIRRRRLRRALARPGRSRSRSRPAAGDGGV